MQITGRGTGKTGRLNYLGEWSLPNECAFVVPHSGLGTRITKQIYQAKDLCFKARKRQSLWRMNARIGQV
jgi:hypothetical protein